MFNVLIHFFQDCTGYPVGINLKSKDKLTSTAQREVTCPDCQRRLTSEGKTQPKVG